MSEIGIYKITSPSNKIYIGQSTNITRRWDEYRKLQCKPQTKLYHSFKKHGVKNHKFEIIHICSIEELDSLEEKYVIEFNSVMVGLNIRYGGGSKGKLSQEQKDTIRKKLKGRSRPKESSLKQSKTLQENGVWNKGKTGIFSQEALKKIGKLHSKESYEKTSLTLLGRKQTPEHKLNSGRGSKLAWDRRKKEGWRNTYHHSEEMKELIRQKSIEFHKRVKQERLSMIF